MKTITAQKIPRRSIFHKSKTRIAKTPKDNSSVVFLGHHNWNLVSLSNQPVFTFFFIGIKYDDWNSNSCEKFFLHTRGKDKC